MQLAKRTFVVTGAGSGLGRELTIQLLHRGANVAGVDINPDALDQTKELAGLQDNRLRVFSFDITDREKVQIFSEEAISHFGFVDGLINNAGIIQPFKPVNALSFEEAHRVMHVNFFGTLNLTKAFLPHLLQRPEAHIVNVSSMGGFVAFPGQTLYGAAKAAVKIFSEGLYAELVGTSVRVSVVFPGAIATNISINSGLEKPKATSTKSKINPLPAQKAAEIILHGIERNKFRILVGSDSRLLDLLYRLSPEYATSLIQKKMKEIRGI